MAGSYRHVTDRDGKFIGVGLLDNLGDAHEALEECCLMIEHLACGDKAAIFEAWRDGYFARRCPKGNDPGTSREFWSDWR